MGKHVFHSDDRRRQLPAVCDVAASTSRKESDERRDEAGLIDRVVALDERRRRRAYLNERVLMENSVNNSREPVVRNQNGRPRANGKSAPRKGAGKRKQRGRPTRPRCHGDGRRLRLRSPWQPGRVDEQSADGRSSTIDERHTVATLMKYHRPINALTRIHNRPAGSLTRRRSNAFVAHWSPGEHSVLRNEEHDEESAIQRPFDWRWQHLDDVNDGFVVGVRNEIQSPI